jgi:hypothetical protein
MVHYWSEDLENVEYLEFILSYFNVSDFEEQSKPKSSQHEVCRYPEFRHPPNTEYAYKRTRYHFKVLAARLGFIIIFQNVVACLQQFIAWVVSEKPANLKSRIKREAYLVSNKIIREEKNKILRNSQKNNEDSSGIET